LNKAGKIQRIVPEVYAATMRNDGKTTIQNTSYGEKISPGRDLLLNAPGLRFNRYQANFGLLKYGL
jgi:hypothetical protein